jgi:alkylhydroperoxidase/carboxymuconolactone decarboxylase family protein YurZ
MTEGSATASAITTEGTKEEEKTPQVVDEFTEFFNQLVAERDRLPEKERPIIYIALLAMAYAKWPCGNGPKEGWREARA